MPEKQKTNKKGGFSLVPITLSEPVKTTDGFTNLIEDVPPRKKEAAPQDGQTVEDKKYDKDSLQAITEEKPGTSADESKQSKQSNPDLATSDEHEKQEDEKPRKETAIFVASGEKSAEPGRLTQAELLQILDADSFDEIYELSDVLRASSLRLYAALVRLADSRGRVRVKNHELMNEAGIKGIATLYKQERWLTELKLVEKKAKPGPHDGSSYFVFGLETLPLPREIYDKFDEYLSGLK